MAVPVYYRVLGLDPGAADQDIQEAFHRLAVLYQPDGTLENALAARRLRLVSEAYSVLGDPIRRAAYDAQLTGPRTRSTTPRTPPESSTVLPTSTEEPASDSSPVAPLPAEGPRRPTLLGRLRRRPFRSMGVVVAVTFVLLGACARPQRPSTDPPLGSPPSIVVPPAATPLVAAMGKAPRSAVAPSSAAQGGATGRGQASPIGTKARPIASQGPASRSTPISTATPVPTHLAVGRSVPNATPPRAKGSGTPARSPTSSLPRTDPRTQGGADRALIPGRHAMISALAMAYEDHPHAPINRSAGCGDSPGRSAMLPFQVDLLPGVAGQPRQAGLQARALSSRPFWTGRGERLAVSPGPAWGHLSAQGRGPDAGAPHGRPQAGAPIVQA